MYPLKKIREGKDGMNSLNQGMEWLKIRNDRKNRSIDVKS
jgi:hypothetical protein